VFLVLFGPYRWSQPVDYLTAWTHSLTHSPTPDLSHGATRVLQSRSPVTQC